MTDSRQHELEVAELREQITALHLQLQQAQKLTALGELVSTTTHEFNNVLMTILNYAKLGLRHKDEASRDKAFDRGKTGGSRRLTRIPLTCLRRKTYPYSWYRHFELAGMTGGRYNPAALPGIGASGRS